MNITANDHPYRVTAVDDANMTANNHPIKVLIEGGVVTPEEFEELERRVDALSTDLTYKGSVEDYAHLPTDAETGDVYTTEDTGVLYVWDGEEWVALNEQKCNVKILTTDDYDYPDSGTKTGISLKKLEPGYYKTGEALTVVNGITPIPLGEGANLQILGKTAEAGFGVFAYYDDGGQYKFIFNGVPQGRVLTAGDLVNNLNYTNSGYALDARQGKALNDKIEGRVIQNAGAPTTSTVGTVGMILEDTTTGDIYHCTNVSGSTYTWEKVGGSDNFRVLTTADYNYPDSGAKTGVALWKLPNGVYVRENKNVTVYNNNTTSGASNAARANILLQGGEVFIVSDDRYNSAYKHIRSIGDEGTYDHIIGAGSASTYTKVTTNGVFINIEQEGKLISGKDLELGIWKYILSGTGAPSSSLNATKGVLYEDTTNGKLYICTDVTGNVRTWEEVGGVNSISMADWNALFGQTIENVNGVGL